MTDSMDLSAEPASLYAAHVEAMMRRTETALAHCPCDGLIVLAGDLLFPPHDDVALPFRVEPHFAAWLPLLEHPGCGLRIVPGEKPLLAYPIAEDFWHAPQSDPDGYWTAHFDIRTVGSAEQARALLEDTTVRCARIGARCAGGERGQSAASDRVRTHLDFARAIKTPYEAACLRLANASAARGHGAALEAARRGESERSIHQHYCAAAGQRETRLPYPNIVALNEHASILHYERLDAQAPAEVRSFLIDAGAQYNGYAADVTRTWGRPGSRFAALGESMDTLQRAVCARVMNGVDFVELNDFTHRLLADVLVEHGIVTCSGEAAYGAGITRAFLPHGLGHLLGLQVHDAGGRQIDPDGALRDPPREHPFLRLTRVLEPGFALTIEPGVYFIPSLLRGISRAQRGLVDWTVVEELLPYGGIRVEDDVIVSPAGCENLTRQAFAA